MVHPPFSIGLAGKGGTGKTTIAGMLIKYLVEKGKTPVLAVDADSNSNLNEVLGIPLRATLGEAREEMRKGGIEGMTKDVFMEMKLEEAVVESEGFDLIAMGRPEGPGCYCAANTLLTRYLERLIHNYASVVIDNEAGMEHLSRLTTNNIDILLVISDASRRGIQAAARIFQLADDLRLRIVSKKLIINRERGEDGSVVENEIRKNELPLLGIIPEDEKISLYDLRGEATAQLTLDQSKAMKSAYRLFDQVIPS